MGESENKSAWGLREIIVLAVALGFLALVAIPNRIDSRKGPGLYSNACINKMRDIDGAANEFALEHGKTNGDAINFPNDLKPYIKLNSKGEIPSCPSGGKYTIGRVGEAPICSLGTNVTPPHILPYPPHGVP